MLLKTFHFLGSSRRDNSLRLQNFDILPILRLPMTILIVSLQCIEHSIIILKPLSYLMVSLNRVVHMADQSLGEQNFFDCLCERHLVALILLVVKFDLVLKFILYFVLNVP